MLRPLEKFSIAFNAAERYVWLLFIVEIILKSAGTVWYIFIYIYHIFYHFLLISSEFHVHIYIQELKSRAHVFAFPKLTVFSEFYSFVTLSINDLRRMIQVINKNSSNFSDIHLYFVEERLDEQKIIFW